MLKYKPFLVDNSPISQANYPIVGKRFRRAPGAVRRHIRRPRLVIITLNFVSWP